MMLKPEKNKIFEARAMNARASMSYNNRLEYDTQAWQ